MMREVGIMGSTTLNTSLTYTVLSLNITEKSAETLTIVPTQDLEYNHSKSLIFNFIQRHCDNCIISTSKDVDHPLVADCNSHY